MFAAIKPKNRQHKPVSLDRFWNVTAVSQEGILFSENRIGFMFEAEGLDGSFLAPDELRKIHDEWRAVLRFEPGDEIQFVFRKRVEFAKWIEDQLSRAFLGKNPYGRRILLDRLADQVGMMSRDEPALLAQKVIICFWTPEKLDPDALIDKRTVIRSQLSAFGFHVKILKREQIETEIKMGAQDSRATERDEAEWPSLKIEAGRVKINKDIFRALELVHLPETHTELGMIQSITDLAYPLDLSVRLCARDLRPIVSRLEKKRNLLSAQTGAKKSPSPNLESQILQIDKVLRSFADKSESVFDIQMTLGLRMNEELNSLQRKALAKIIRAATKMDFCDLDEVTLGTFDAYLECIPSFSGTNLRKHTVLGSNAIHFLPFFRPSKGDRRAIASFQTRGGTLYSIDPIDPHMANYNWLVSGTSGAGKSFFVNSLLAQSSSIEPNIFIVDIGGSYNKLTQFLGGQVMSLEPGQGFELSPFFLPKSDDPKEERLRRQHIYQIFLEMIRVDGELPAIEIRHLLQGVLEPFFDLNNLPEHPITALVTKLKEIGNPEANRLSLLLSVWSQNGFFAQFLDTNKLSQNDNRILTFDLKGLTEFEDLSRVVQLIVCAGLWARIRRSGSRRFSWIVLDEVAFSLLKTQPGFVDELVSTLRKYFAGAVIVVQDLEKITSNVAGASILQNAQTKAILQQRGDPRNFSEALSLTQIDQWAIESLSRKKGSYSDIFLMRDNDRTVIRHVPSDLEYWLSTTAPEETLQFQSDVTPNEKDYQKKVMKFVAKKKEGAR